MPNKAHLKTRTADTSTVSSTSIATQALTHAELDSNLINLRDQTFGIASDDSTVIDVGFGNTLKVAGAGSITTSVSGQTLTITGSASAQGVTFVGDDSTGTQISDGETVKIAGASGITTAMSGDTLTITGPSLTGYLTDIVNDTTPQLGGSLDVNSNSIISSSNGTITIQPNGTGYVSLGYGDLKANLSQSNALVNNNVNVDHGANRVWVQTLDQSTVSSNTQRVYANNDLVSVQLTGTTGTNSNNRIRQISAVELDLNGINFGYTQSGYLTPVVANQGLAVILNKNATAATMTHAQATNGYMQVGDNNNLGDITMTDAIGMSGSVELFAPSGKTTSLTNAYGQYAYLATNASPGTKNITNWYALYAADTSATVTNKYGVYVANPTHNNYIGGLNFANGAISTADSTAIQIDESLNVSGTLNAKILVANEISSEDSTAIHINDGLTVTGDIKGDSIIINNISSGDSTAIQLNDALNVSGALTTEGSTTFNSFYRDKINALTSSSTITVNAALAPVHKVTLAVNTQINIANLPTGGNITLIIVQDATGNRTASFTSDTSTAVKFAGGTSTLSTAANSIDVINIFNDGTNYLGSLAKAFA